MLPTRHLLPVFAVVAAHLALPAEEVVSVPLGVTNLLDDPACTVGYQRDGHPPQSLGWRWTGFDSATGVYFVPEEREGRRQVFMHCPWKQGPGAAFADFALQLPQTKRIRLAVSCALRSGARMSDGVTYRVRVDGQTVWQVDCAWKVWRDFTIDLSRFAGKRVVLRLEVDPGPKRSTRDDWSLWGKADVVAGSDAEVAAARARREKERAAQLRRELDAAAQIADADLTPFARADVRTSRPSTAGPVANSLTREGRVWVMRCRGRDETVAYRFAPEKGLLAGLSVTVNGARLDPEPFAGGAWPVLAGRRYAPASQALSVQLLSADEERGELVCRYKFRAANAPDTATLTARLRPEGKSLALSLAGGPNRFDGFEVRTKGGPRVATAFCVGPAPRYHRQGVYVAAFADLWQSDASSVGGSSVRTRYSPLTNGRRQAMRDTFYLTVSRRYEETLPNVPHPPSPFLGELAHRVVMDVWRGTFAEDEQWLQGLARYGVTQFLIIKHVWQRDGYDHTYPNIMPANARQGGDAALRRLSMAAQRIGHRFCVHENFYDYYPNAEAFRQADCALSPDGKPQLGWNNGSVRARILKPSRLMDYARRFTPEVKRRYDCNAAYHDIMPTWRVDFDARVPGSGMIRRTHEYTKQLCDYDRALFGGPVVFEAASPHMAGVYDGGCNHGVDTYRTPPAVAFELLKVHPKMSNHGFGYYERWLPDGYNMPSWPTYIMTDRGLDKYRATQIAFGRTGFIGQQLRRHPHALVREYYLMQAFGRAYTGQELRRLAYFVARAGWSGWVDAGTACRLGEWSRMRATYEGGQRVYVNLADQPWSVAGRTLPPSGMLTAGPRASAYTAIVDGQIADFAQYGDTIFVDARSHQWLPPEPPPPITPSLAAWKDNGDGSFDLTVDWKVGRTLPRNFTVFCHFKDGPRILFQADHAPPKPTRQWRVGETVGDGPRRVKAPADQQQPEYDVVVGLYDKSGRAALVAGADQMRVAKLVVDRRAGKIIRIALKPIHEPPRPGATPGPYLQSANRDKRIIDFGPVASNGAAVLRKTRTALEVVPVPIGETMRVGVAGAFTHAAAVDAAGKPLPEIGLVVKAGKTWFDMPKRAAKVVLR